MTKMGSRELAGDLRALGLTFATRASLLALPVVQVAWRTRRSGSSRVRRAARRAIGQLGLDAACEGIAESWLRREPERDVFERGYRVLRRLAVTPEELELGHAELVRSLTLAQAVAEVDCDPEVDLPTTSPQSAANALGVDVGSQWSDVARSLDDVPLAGFGRLP